jgi:hypothetical protein
MITELPELPNKLSEIICKNNILLSLPKLPSFLKKLVCNNNLLTELPMLPNLLESLFCQNNQLSHLPKLPHSLITLYCSNNNLCLLPDVDTTLVELYTIHNCLPYKRITRKCINETNEKIKKYKYLFYCLKYKKKFKRWLWEYVREKKIKMEYHPSVISNKLLKYDINDIMYEEDTFTL